MTWLVVVVDRVIVPLLLLAQFVRSGLVVRMMARPALRSSGRAGFWAGTALTVLMIPVVVTAPPSIWADHEAVIRGLAAVLILPTVWLLWLQTLFSAAARPWVVGVVTLAMTTMSGIALVLVLLVDALHGPVRVTTLLALAALLAMHAVRPERVRGDDRPPVLYE